MLRLVNVPFDMRTIVLCLFAFLKSGKAYAGFFQINSMIGYQIVLILPVYKDIFAHLMSSGACSARLEALKKMFSPMWFLPVRMPDQ